MNTPRFSMKMITLTLASAFAMGVIIATDAPVIARDISRTAAYTADVVGHAAEPPPMLAKSFMESGSSQGPQGASWNQSAGRGQDKPANSFGEKEPAPPQGDEWIEDYFKSGEARNPFLRK